MTKILSQLELVAASVDNMAVPVDNIQRGLNGFAYDVNQVIECAHQWMEENCKSGTSG